MAGILLSEGLSEARDCLLEHYRGRLKVNPSFDRKLVSFQANRTIPLYSWFKYKEGFSAPLVHHVLSSLTHKPGTLLDPFAGSGAALFAAQALGWNTIGIELLPVGMAVMQARLAAQELDPGKFVAEVKKIEKIDLTRYYTPEATLPHVPITRGAFSAETEKSVAAYRNYCAQKLRDSKIRRLFDFACLAVLETVSYTRKDGQYLRWDHRSGRGRGSKPFNKGEIPTFSQAIISKLHTMADDLITPSDLFDVLVSNVKSGSFDVRQGSCIEILPDLPSGSIDFVLTSPPYCNRYDYTRTYALELVYLGCDADEISRFRQAMLSCTVENKCKLDDLAEAYEKRRRSEDFREILKTFEGNEALQEVLALLEEMGRREELNNVNVPRMVRNYFLEMCCVIAELSRMLRRGGKIVMVNDNVRYGGEEVPVDLILSEFAESFGLRTKVIWTLPRGKGNSSQQMGVHGRTELRKCVYVWEK